MELGTSTDAAAAAPAKTETRKQPGHPAELSPAIRDLISRFTVIEDEATFDRTAFARAPVLQTQ